jgi:hypothetical protein
MRGEGQESANGSPETGLWGHEPIEGWMAWVGAVEASGGCS